ncbi:putative reverse transcriptase domain-containing protein [Tanacetum coccineum]
MVASRPSSPSGLSSHDTLAPSFEFPIALIVAPLGIRRRPAILIRLSEAIPFGRPYHTHLNGPRKLLTARKRVGPIRACRLAWRCVSHHSSDRHSSPDSTSGSFSSDSSSDSSSNTSSGSSSDSLLDSSLVHSSGCDSHGQTHSGPSTRVASPRLVYPPVLTPRHSEEFRRWRSAPLSTPYLPTTSESSLGSSSERSLDSSSPSARPSRKRCRFRDSHSPEDSGEEHMEVGTADVEVVADLGTSVGVGAHTKDGIGMGVEVVDSDIREDEEDIEVEASAGGTVEIKVDPRVGPIVVEDIPKHVTADGAEIPVSRIADIETGQRQLEVGQLIAGGERDGLTDRVRSLVRENQKVRALLCNERDRVDSLRHHMALSQEEFRQVRRDRNDTRRRLRRLESFGIPPLVSIEELVNRRMEEALAAYEETRAANALEAESQSQNGSDGDNGNGGNGNGRNRNGGNRNGENGNGGNGNGGNRNGRNGNPNENGRGDRPVVRECTYQDFIKCQPLNFKGTKGVVGLTRWFEKMETMFHISNCLEKYQVKYATCTLLNSALSWWNSHKRTIGTDAAFPCHGESPLRLLGHPFNINLMTVELGSFDVIIGMYWLANHHAVIVCDEKIVRIPYGDEVLIVQGDRSDKGKKSKLIIISCIKTHAAPAARAPYRLAPLELHEMSTQLQELSDK